MGKGVSGSYLCVMKLYTNIKTITFENPLAFPFSLCPPHSSTSAPQHLGPRSITRYGSLETRVLALPCSWLWGLT